MTREQVREAAERMLPELEIALHAILSGQALHIFECGAGTNSVTGVQSRIFCFIAQEHAAILLEAVAQGANKSAEFLMEQAQKALASQVQQP